MHPTIDEIAANFATLEGVEALVLAGSTTTGLADEGSDYDLYAYTREPVPLEFRARLLKPRAARLELHNTFWEWSDEWIEPDGAVFDLMYRSCDLIEADRTAAWLASYFDILFAANRLFHPGEKRLLAQLEKLPSAPVSTVEDVRTICSRAVNLERCIADHLGLVRRRLEVWLTGKGVL